MGYSRKKAIKRVIAIGLILVGGYYLLISAGVIPSQVFFLNYSPSTKILALISIGLIAIGLILDDVWRTKIKNALSWGFW